MHGTIRPAGLGNAYRCTGLRSAGLEVYHCLVITSPVQPVPGRRTATNQSRRATADCCGWLRVRVTSRPAAAAACVCRLTQFDKVKTSLSGGDALNSSNTRTSSVYGELASRDASTARLSDSFSGDILQRTTCRILQLPCADSSSSEYYSQSSSGERRQLDSVMDYTRTQSLSSAVRIGKTLAVSVGTF